MKVKKIRDEILFYLIVLLLCLILLFPIFIMVSTSFKTSAETIRFPYTLLPQQWTLDNYRYLFDKSVFDFPRYFRNSLYISTVTAIVAVLIGIMGGYALSRLRFPGRSFMNESLLFVYMFSGLLLIVPLYKLLLKLNMTDSKEAVILCMIVQTMPTSVYMMRSYFATIPRELEEAGAVDGLTRSGVIFRLVAPLSIPGIITVFVYAFMISWNDILFPTIFIDSTGNMPLTIAMRTLFDAAQSEWGRMMAVSILTGLPIVIMYAFSQRLIRGGLTDGGVKG